MKTLFFKLIILLVLVTTFAACDQYDQKLKTHVTAVQNIDEPADNYSVTLKVSTNLIFSWEPATAEDGEMVLYEVFFDRMGGDFSNPVSIVVSDQSGSQPRATISHAQLNDIAAQMGIEKGGKGKFIWTVVSSKGINPMKATQSRTLEVSRSEGLSDDSD